LSFTSAAVRVEESGDSLPSSEKDEQADLKGSLS